MTKMVSYVFGAVLVVVGLWGFVQNPVLGLFAANTNHNIVHLVSGLVLLAVAMWWPSSASLTLKILGIVYALVAIVGFAMGGDSIFGIIDNSIADDVLHTLLAVVFLWAGFMGDKSASTAVS